MRTDSVQGTDLKRYVPHVIVATAALFVVPLAAAYRLSEPPFHLGLVPTAVIATLASLGLAHLGAALWSRHPGSRDVVFEDLLLWGFCLRLLNQRRVIKNSKALARGLSRGEELNALQKLAKFLESGDPYTHRHSDRVARHAYMTARAMKLPRRTREKVRLAAALHDVGKLRTPREVLTKPGRLTAEEYEIIKKHPGDGADMVAALHDDELTVMVRHHHERMDGTGYPDRLHGDSIPIGARIIAVVDTFDAITSRRPYRAARKHKDAIDILIKESGTQLDEAAVKAFLAYYAGRRGIRLWLSLSTSLPRVIETVTATLRRAATNAAVVGGTTAAVVGGVVVVADGPTSPRAVERERVAVSEAAAPESDVVESDAGPLEVVPLLRDGGAEPKNARHDSTDGSGQSSAGSTSETSDGSTLEETSSGGSASNETSTEFPTSGDGSNDDSGTTDTGSGSTDTSTTTDGTTTETGTGTSGSSGGSTTAPSGDSGSTGGGSGSTGSDEPAPSDGTTVTTPIVDDTIDEVVDTVGGLLSH